MKFWFRHTAFLLALAGTLSFSAVARAQQAPEPGSSQLRELFEKLAESDLADGPEADEIRKLLKRVQEGKPLSPDQFAKLFEKVQGAMPSGPPSELAKNHERVRRVFRPVVKQATQSTVAVLKNGKPAAMGTVVDDQGHILTKASELKLKNKKFSGSLMCKTAGGKPRKATIVGVHEAHDLALLKTDSNGLTPIKWHTDAAPPVGSWLASTGLSQDPVAVGVVSVAPRKIGFGGGFLGVMLGESEQGPSVERIVPKSSAAEAGLQVGDIVIKIGDERMKTREQMVETVRDYKPGETIMLRILRDEEQVEVRVVLGRRDMSVMRAGRLHAMNRMGGSISNRRTNFPNALQHDTVLKPEQCGGPIVDLDGHAVGINIARAGRVMSYAIPAKTVTAVLPELKSGKLAPAADQLASSEAKPANPKTKPELEAVLEEIRKAEAELRRSQEKLRKAREALEQTEDE